MPRLLPLLCLAVALPLALAAPAGAEVKQLTYRVGPIDVGPYQVRQNGADIGIPKPDVDGFITRMETNVVDADGTPVPIQRLMLHHIVFANLGSTLGEKKDATCDAITNLDSVSQIPAFADRFYGAGEERAKLNLPPGYGYRVGGGDLWAMTWMMMNHRAQSDRAYIEYKITYDTAPDLTGVEPVWMDVNNCKADPVYDVPGGGTPGSTTERDMTWTPPAAGRVIAGAGHMHGGGTRLELSQPSCADRLVASSQPTWGAASHPFYNVKPVLHEPGPVHMTGFSTASGIPYAAGEPLKLTSIYDAERPHTRVMGIMVVYVAPPSPGAPADPCVAPPGDVQLESGPGGGRTASPRVTVPLTGLDRNGKARTIKGPPGRLRRLAGSSATVKLKSYQFSRPNLSVRKGAKINWRFEDDDLHDVTLASGPRGFSSPHYATGGRFAQKLTVPGTYRLFCSLHPVRMTERIVVRR